MGWRVTDKDALQAQRVGHLRVQDVLAAKTMKIIILVSRYQCFSLRNVNVRSLLNFAHTTQRI